MRLKIYSKEVEEETLVMLQLRSDTLGRIVLEARCKSSSRTLFIFYPNGTVEKCKDATLDDSNFEFDKDGRIKTS